MGIEGVRIAVTRTADQASELRRALEAEGARVTAFPLIRLAAADPEPLVRALRAPADWVVFTSANAVGFSAEALAGAGSTAAGATGAGATGAGSTAGSTRTELPAAGSGLPAALGAARIACVGPATAAAAEAAGLQVTAVPDTFTGTAVCEAMGGAAALQGARVLWPRAERARESLRASLEAAGATVRAPVAYRTVADRAGARALATAVLQREVDVVTFTSPSGVRSLAAELPALRHVVVAVIGPVTAAAARAAGYQVDVIAAEHTVAGLVAGLRAYHGRGGAGRNGEH